jgi:5-methylcytosine-specific restriction endonuclease McrA
MDTLVLNAAYMPINRVPWQRAFTWIFTGRAEVVEEYEDRTVRSPSFEFKMPAIIRFLGKVVGLFRRAVKFNRHNVYLRDKGRCAYCGNQIRKSDFTYDHVVPRSQGGKTVWNNVVIACLPCNQRKANRTPAQARMKLRVKPVRPKSLPGQTRLLRWEVGMPETWRDYLGSVSYWQDSLEG